MSKQEVLFRSANTQGISYSLGVFKKLDSRELPEQYIAYYAKYGNVSNIQVTEHSIPPEWCTTVVVYPAYDRLTSKTITPDMLTVEKGPIATPFEPVDKEMMLDRAKAYKFTIEQPKLS